MQLCNLFKNKKQNKLKFDSSLSISSDEKLSLLKPSNTNRIKTNYAQKASAGEPETATLMCFGYETISTTEIAQGQLIEACSINDKMQKFSIKKVDRKSLSLSQTKSAEIIKEASFLRCCSDSKYVCNYIDFFNDENYYYLVTEQYSGGITLKKWIQIVFEYIKNGTVDVKEYRNKVKNILWQISNLLYWLHQEKKVCHLRVTTENIIILNGPLGDIQVKLCDFSASKEFDIESEQADVWSLGILLYELAFGEYPNQLVFSVVKYNRLRYHICNLSQYTTRSMLKIICGLLVYDQKKRMNLLQIIQCKYFEDCVLYT